MPALLAAVFSPAALAVGLIILAATNKTVQADLQELLKSFTTDVSQVLEAPTKPFVEYMFVALGLGTAMYLLYLHQAAGGQLPPPPPPVAPPPPSSPEVKVGVAPLGFSLGPLSVSPARTQSSTTRSRAMPSRSRS